MARRKRGAYRSTKHTRKGAITSFGSRTDVGCVRDHNEDSLIVRPPLFVVADGMGGHAAGEVASEIAVNVIGQCAPDFPDAEELGRAVEEANRAIIDAALSGKGRAGMGTTCTAAMLEGTHLVLAQVGDSRAYLLQDGKLQQLTRDHSLMESMIEAGQITPEEARVHPKRSVITRALGNDPATRPDLYEVDVKSGDRLLLCSDGLTSMLLDSEIESILNRIPDPQRCAAQLVNESIAAGGFDNITVIVVDVQGDEEKHMKKLVRRSRGRIALVLLLLVAIIAGTGYGSYRYLHNTAYLANNDGYVTIYRGVPGDVFGISYSELVEQTDVAVDSLSPSAADSINGNMRVDSVDKAKQLVQSYRDDAQAKADAQAELDARTAEARSSASSSSSSSSASKSSSSTATTTNRTTTTTTGTTSTGNTGTGTTTSTTGGQTGTSTGGR
jgi:protein phosphatase